MDAAARDDGSRSRLLTAIADFTSACERRLPFAEYIDVDFSTVLPKRPPSVAFGHGHGRATAVRYRISPLGQMDLNGLTVFEEDFDETWSGRTATRGPC
ncbi:hypothetical protein MOD31_18690 [Paenarthrobacter sp. TYUT067]|uniref:hypothetical protein n=1 Tax=Paenarthrobacter sp. TYUT067 TaxID=2926245 RepID=UPI0020303582|nr:hypothetical protein [Paenarthrobacter sp. TYUT067]MCM0618055.1 hypothetical protein [Paenarthrobacter sp. TYUT067]